VNSRPSHEARSLLATRSQLVQIRCDLENEIKDVQRTFGILFGMRVGGFARRAEEIATGELDSSPTIRTVVMALMKARTDMLAQIRTLDASAIHLARQHHCPAPHDRPRRGGRHGARHRSNPLPAIFERRRYLGLTPTIYASEETRRVRRISRRGDDFLRRSLYEAANALLTRIGRFSTLKSWGLRVAKRGGFKKAKVAVANKLAIVLHATWKTGNEFRLSAETHTKPA
jgi:transposase